MDPRWETRSTTEDRIAVAMKHDLIPKDDESYDETYEDETYDDESYDETYEDETYDDESYDDETYDDETYGTFDYPKLRIVSQDSKDPCEDSDWHYHLRNYGEMVRLFRFMNWIIFPTIHKLWHL